MRHLDNAKQFSADARKLGYWLWFRLEWRTCARPRSHRRCWYSRADAGERRPARISATAAEGRLSPPAQRSHRVAGNDTGRGAQHRAGRERYEVAPLVHSFRESAVTNAWAGLPFASGQQHDCNDDGEPDNDGSARQINVPPLETPRARCRNRGGHQQAPSDYKCGVNSHGCRPERASVATWPGLAIGSRRRYDPACCSVLLPALSNPAFHLLLNAHPPDPIVSTRLSMTAIG
jgi:hypothetical protein